MNSQTTRTVLTSQFSDYQQPLSNSLFLEEWLNKLKADQPQKYTITDPQPPSLSQFTPNPSITPPFKPNPLTQNKSSFYEYLGKENIQTVTNRNRESNKTAEKSYVAAMKALQSKVKALEAERVGLKEEIKHKESMLDLRKHDDGQRLRDVSDKHQRLLVLNNQYMLRLTILEHNLIDNDRVKTENFRLREEIKRLEGVVMSVESTESHMAKKYSDLLRDFQERISSYSTLQFQHQLLTEQTEISKGEIRALKVKLMNYEHNSQQYRTKTLSQHSDILKTNTQLAQENQRLCDKLAHSHSHTKALEETYLSELQRQEESLQQTKRDKDVLKEKCKQLETQLEYLKETITQKDSTLVDLCKSREGEREILMGGKEQSSVRPEYYENRRLSRQLCEFDEVMDNQRQMSYEQEKDKSLEMNSRLAQSEYQRKPKEPTNEKRRSKSREKTVSNPKSHPKKPTTKSKSKDSSTLPFQNVLIKLKTSKPKLERQQDTDSLDSSSPIPATPHALASPPKDSQSYNRILLIQSQKQAIRLYQTHQNLLQQSKDIQDMGERGEYLGRLKQIDQEIRSNNQKIHRLKETL